MREHIRILGILNIVMGGFAALAGVAVLVIMGGVASIAALNLHDDPENAKIAAPLLGVIGILVAGFLLVLALPSIIGGWGLLKYKSWSRLLMIVISGLHLLSVPLGTALGVYGLWVLLNEQARQLLESGGAFPPPATYPMQPQQQPVNIAGTPPPQSF